MALAALAPSSEREAPPRKRFTRAEVSKLLDSGIFDGQRFELIEGDLINKMRQTPPHAATISRLMRLLSAVFGLERVRVQLPILVSGCADQEWSEPEPDVAITAAADSASEFEDRHPDARELMLVVEVADTTAEYDATKKRDLYARAGVPEYWVLDINRGVLVVHRSPSGAKGGGYGEVKSLSRNQTVSIEGVKIPVSKMLAMQLSK